MMSEKTTYQAKGLMKLCGLIGFIGFMGLTSCSDDDDAVRRQPVVVELQAYVAPYTDVEAEARSTTPVTRDNTWMPTGFYPFSELDGVNGVLMSNDNAAIRAFFTNDDANDKVIDRKFTIGHDNKWRIDEEIELAGDYYLYGYVAYSAADVDNTTIEPNGTYENGAILTLNGLNSVMNQDVCVIVGAKHGTKSDATAPVLPATDPMMPGDFLCQINAGSNPNYIFLLFDHLYAALRFRFRVDEEYAALRYIMLKKLELLAYQDEACEHLMTKKVNTTVTLKANTTGASPIVSDIVFTPNNTSGNMAPVLIYDNENPTQALPSGKDEQGNYIYSDDMGFVPKTSSYYLLRTTYDVYDLKHNLIRKDCVAENKIDPRKLFNKESLDRGHMYTMRLTVMPTFLYVLSDPDLDNPTMILNE